MLIGHQCGTQAVVKESSPVGVGHVSQRELVHAVEEVSAVKQVDLRLEPVFLMAFAEHGEERMVEDRLRTLSLHSPLLLAYSGGYITLLMVFAANGTSPADFLNSTLVSAELVKTLVGIFGLVLVAPFTAFASAALFSRKSPRPGSGGAK